MSIELDENNLSLKKLTDEVKGNAPNPPTPQAKDKNVQLIEKLIGRVIAQVYYTPLNSTLSLEFDNGSVLTCEWEKDCGGACLKEVVEYEFD